MPSAEIVSVCDDIQKFTISFIVSEWMSVKCAHKDDFSYPLNDKMPQMLHFARYTSSLEKCCHIRLVSLFQLVYSSELNILCLWSKCTFIPDELFMNRYF